MVKARLVMNSGSPEELPPQSPVPANALPNAGVPHAQVHNLLSSPPEQSGTPVAPLEPEETKAILLALPLVQEMHRIQNMVGRLRTEVLEKRGTSDLAQLLFALFQQLMKYRDGVAAQAPAFATSYNNALAEGSKAMPSYITHMRNGSAHASLTESLISDPETSAHLVPLLSCYNNVASVLVPAHPRQNAIAPYKPQLHAICDSLYEALVAHIPKPPRA